MPHREESSWGRKEGGGGGVFAILLVKWVGEKSS